MHDHRVIAILTPVGLGIAFIVGGSWVVEVGVSTKAYRLPSAAPEGSQSLDLDAALFQSKSMLLQVGCTAVLWHLNVLGWQS